MKIVIDIPKELYDYMQSETYDKHLDRRFDYRIRFAVKNGIPLPKGHGRLIDVDKLRCDARYLREDGVFVYVPAVSISTIINAPTVIEADKEKS